MKKLEDLKKLVDRNNRMKLVVASAEEENVLVAVEKAFSDGLIEPVLVGDKEKIAEYVEKNNLDFGDCEIIGASSFEDAAEKSVRMVSEGKGDFLIKGLLDTGILLKAVLNKDWGLRTGKQLSHVMLYEIEAYHKLLMMTDGGMVTYPDLDTKVQLINNAVEAAKGLKYETVKVACLAAKEKVNPKMPATVDAGFLKEMYQDGKFPENVIVEGPMALDLAVSKEAAEIKNYESPVAGDADVLLVPNIEMGNGIGKAITYFGNGTGAGVVMGAKAPIVLVSRADTFDSKYYSILFGGLVASANKE
ncbi:phosphate butyryltransferase [Dethiosulfatibacter aminovorans DSM 17477]|uniref:Phosphate butyryltransferase n=1 Tax=Dethiosulfatibacter aminovorans DSM 17477 TaxID=1121476 RepID=A0A1M6L818_9FIRM|nr:phosphate acyltransferase [Dethiosulfatibacter aminovorans]SHJ67361.1 phosphate butyryltransferase [Dethiosulfatibacter aminovorans DSM 17477]